VRAISIPLGDDDFIDEGVVNKFENAKDDS
jgi:hypothetical protein